MSWRRYRTTLWVALLLAALSGYWLARHGLDTLRFDGSAKGLFTLSARNKLIARTISEPIDITLITSMGGGYSQPMPPGNRMDRYSRQVIVFLESLRRASHNKVRIHVLQAKPGSLARQLAQSVGMTPVHLSSEQPYYLGVVGRNSVDTEIVIPFLDPDSGPLLESQLMQMVTNLDNPNLKTVALITSFPDIRQLPNLKREDREAQLAAQLARRYDVIRLDESFDDIPNPTNLLLIVHPFSLTDRQLYLIDQFILDKGRALIFLDPLGLRSFSPRGRPLFSGAVKRSDLQPLLKNWGLELADPILTQGANLEWVPEWVDPQTSPKQLGDEATGINGWRWQGGGFWLESTTPSPSEGWSRRDLLRAPEGAITRAAEFPALPKPESPSNATGPSASDKTDKPFAAPSFVIGVALNGKLTTAFPNGSPPRPRISGLNPDPAPLKSSKQNTKLVLFADADALNPLSPDSENSTAMVVQWVDSLLAESEQGPTVRNGSFRNPWKAVSAENAKLDAPIRANRKALEMQLAQWRKERQALEARGFGAPSARPAATDPQDLPAAPASLRIQSDANAQWTRKERARIVALRNQEREIQRQLITLNARESTRNKARQWPWMVLSLGIIPGIMWIASVLLWIRQRPRRVSHGRL